MSSSTFSDLFEYLCYGFTAIRNMFTPAGIDSFVGFVRYIIL